MHARVRRRRKLVYLGKARNLLFITFDITFQENLNSTEWFSSYTTHYSETSATCFRARSDSDLISPSHCSRPSFLLKQAKALQHIPHTLQTKTIPPPFTALEMMPPFCDSHGGRTGVLLWSCGESPTPFC